MAQTIIFNRQIAGGVVDSVKTKSEITIPVHYPKDLAGCGSDTHDYNSVAGQFNVRVNCRPPAKLYGWSVSGYALTAAEATARGGAALAQYTATDATFWGTIRTFLSEAIISAQGGNYQFDNAPARLVANGLGAFVRRGNNWLAFDNAPPLKPSVTATMQVPRLTPFVDPCGLEVGVNGVTSLSLVATDSNCRPILVNQISLKMFISTDPLIIAANWDITNVVPAIVETISLAVLQDNTPAGTIPPNHVQDTVAPLPFSVAFPNTL